MKIGFVGLGKMGKGIVTHLLKEGVEVVCWNRSRDDIDEVVTKGAVGTQSHKELISKLTSPRIVWLMVPQGTPVDEMIDLLTPHLSSGDLIVDGGNSFYKDTIRRHVELIKKGIRFMDVGVSGGPSGALNGACLMVGGSKKDYKLIAPILKLIAAPGALAHLGDVGAGHFAKMVHNGIEYGMMEAIAEGAAVLKESRFNFNLSKVFDLYNQRSVIESRFSDGENLGDISSIIEATGEGEWTVKTATELGVDVPVIKKSLQIRKDSTNMPDNFRNRVVSALRGKFGGHSVKKPN
ncbi:MAG: 6-phosphogluconate dehydrogenase, decarboxylating [Candidatus Woesebacteria bacterium GW2011_GWB1_38_5b]|uniref:6-phosphogluconate dehydrogenase, decarboxylating n=1 Tax=Candidatus Woesebacteria bacterium GW2011_GWB1_38_5b TaxID=1618569 RepID=A0A0G0MNK5_9BACT|nr:MAG: 6-phosphogluconate dehydrogenase, decarboxylating [Candidatus Woesebacteria bacterium GW2011_GWB1_38_5b]